MTIGGVLLAAGAGSRSMRSTYFSFAKFALTRW